MKSSRLLLCLLLLLSGCGREARHGNPARDFGESVADAVERVMPSVVVVRTEAIQYQLRQDWFGIIYRIPRRLAGQGSGVIIDRRGYVLTSNHVIDGAREIEVVLNSAEKYAAQLVGTDPVTDLAVLKIDSDRKDFPAADVADSDKVRVGEVAIAIGSPYSLQSSVTVGTVSQKGREIGLLQYEDFIQTDASINPGNSGGPLVNAEGELIGINAAIQTPEDGGSASVGIAFAVPSNLALTVGRALIETGVHQWPWLGVGMKSFEELGLPESDGVPVVEVWNRTPAQRAGLIPGDVILEIDGTSVVSVRDVHRAVLQRPLGSRVRVLLQRQGRKYEAELETVPLPRR